MLDDRGALVLALALDSGEDAVEGGLHANHLALHDLHDGPVSRGHAMWLWVDSTYQVLALEAGKTPVGGGSWWMGHEQGLDMAGGREGRAQRRKTHSTEAEDNAWTFFFSGFSNTQTAPLSWHRRHGAWQRAARAGRVGGQTGDGTGATVRPAVRWR